MPAKKKAKETEVVEITPEVKPDIPEVDKPKGKAKKDEEIKAAPSDVAPVIPNIEPDTEEPAPVEDVPEEVTEEVAEEPAPVNFTFKDLEQRLTNMSCYLVDRVVGEDNQFNTAGLHPDQINSIEVILKAYNSLKSKTEVK